MISRPSSPRPAAAQADTLRPGALFCYNMLSYQDARWAAHFDVKSDNSIPLAQRIAAMEKQPPDFELRCSIRSVFDGRYRFSPLFLAGGLQHSATWEELTAKNEPRSLRPAERPRRGRTISR